MLNKFHSLTTHSSLSKLNNPNFKQNVIALSICAGVILVGNEVFAANGPDAFEGILKKANGWVGGSAGKLITFTSFAMAGIMGVAGFPTKYVVGAVGTGLLLSSAEGLVNMIF